MTRKIKYPNGDVYIGDAVGLFKPVREGFGTLTNRRGDVYEGEWKDDKRHGQATYTYKNGDVFRGTYRNDSREKGRIDFVNGDYYEGEFCSGEYSGDGKLYTKSTDTTYVGHFSSGYKYGVGTETCAEYTYKGRFTHGRFHNEGRLDYKNGDFAEGTFKSGALEKGTCRRTNADGSVYEGTIADFVYGGGNGTLTLPDGSVYTGSFHKGKYHGKGRLTKPDGTVIRGDFIEGKLSTAAKGVKTDTEEKAAAPEAPKKPAGPDYDKIFSDLRVSVEGAVKKAQLERDKVLNPKPRLTGMPVITPESAAKEARGYAEDAKLVLAKFEERHKRESEVGGAISPSAATKTFFDSKTGKPHEYRGALNYKGQPHGYGIMKYAGGAVYEGEWEWEKPCGIGRYKNESRTYTGEFSDSVYNGVGALVYHDGDSYLGKFSSGKPQCCVRVNPLDNSRYEGGFNSEMQYNGHGILYAEGCELQFFFVNGVSLGAGCLKSPKFIFRGHISSSDFAGVGVMEYHDGSLYEGEVKGFLPDGHGKMTDQRGNIIAGCFSDSKPHGYCEALIDGKKSRIQCEMGKPVKAL